MAHEDGVNCTAQHIPNGSLMVYEHGQHERSGQGRANISTLDVVPSIIKFFGLEVPAYMRGTPSIDLSR
jgi:hypothetical protein